MRGLCHKCHGEAKEMVDGGIYTWEELQEHGWALDTYLDWAKYEPVRIRCTACDVNYPTLRAAADGCGYAASTVSRCVNGIAKMPRHHNWIRLSKNSND